MSSPFPTLRRPTLTSPPSTAKDRSSTASTLLRTPSLRTSTSVTSLSSLFALHSAAVPISSDTTALITRAFVPHIAVHVSADTDLLAREKGFRSFADLLRPYGEELEGKITVRDSQGISNAVEDFGVRFVGLEDVARSGEFWESGVSRAARGGNVSVNGRTEKSRGATEEEERGVYVGGNLDEIEELVRAHLERIEDAEVTLTEAGVYPLFLRRLLSALPVSPHETFSHPVACVIAISSRNENPIETLRNLYTSGNQVELPGYIGREYLRYYVLVHDEDRDDITKSTALFDQMKKHFGLHCHLLRLRSGGRTAVTDDDAVPVPPSQWIAASEELAEIRSQEANDIDPTTLYLPETDAGGLRTMVREMAQVSVVPFMERCVATWNDQIASRRRGISGRFLSMSKRYFGSTSSRSSTSSTSNYDQMTGSYSPSTPEAQMRKLADYAFMLRDYKLAHSIYDLLRTDFNNDKAWKYHAGAQEMTVIALVLTGAHLSHKTRTETIDPLLDLAVYSYLTRCAETFSAIRTLLISLELLRAHRGGPAEDAAKLGMRARDIPRIGPIAHACITERIGECYALRQGVESQLWGLRRRKAAMWKIWAAREWCDIGAIGRGVARRCVEDAEGVYDGVGFAGVREWVDSLRLETGAGVVETVERVEMGRRRKSLIGPPVGELEIEAEEADGFGEESTEALAGPPL